MRRVAQVVSPPVVPCVMCVLRMDLGGEGLLADDRDPQLQPFGNVSLENHRAVLNGRRITDITLRDHLRITAEGVATHGTLKSKTSQLAYDVTVVFVVKRQKLFPAVGDQGGRQLHAQFSSQPQMRNLELSTLDRRRAAWKPAARDSVPQVLDKKVLQSSAMNSRVAAS